MFTLEEIKQKSIPIAKKYGIKNLFLFGSYARGEANEESDLNFLVIGGKNFKLTKIFSLSEDLCEIKKVDVFEINPDNKFYKKIMEEQVEVI